MSAPVVGICAAVERVSWGVWDGYEVTLAPRNYVRALQKAGAVGEIVGWAYDQDGRLIDGITNDRVASAPLPSRERSLVIAIAMGARKVSGILAAVNRRLVNGLITDERTAAALLGEGEW